MVNPIQPNNGVAVLPVDAFPDQKSNTTQEILVPIVDRKDEVPSSREEISREEVEKAAEKMNRMMGIVDKRMKFSVDDKNHQVSVKVIDSDTGKVLGEVPPKSLMELMGSFSSLAGLILNKFT
ncbi:flagellar protein FlaG [Desulfosporosinus acididurans]|uniref:Flagellar protein FlaG n=1 Tax=Desulfosporosinus acididurans TaxID=476652 RepID=A0A0J1FSB1_9FIRM|nr:flagellar protein FlaG [Desulfosporosinus acididurans]KLU65878.1 flagellar protein FlaG [Desulfosporosinus acididurans]